MKKLSIIILSLLLVLIVGQAAFAKNSISLNAGYAAEIYVGSTRLNSGINLGLSGNYYFTNNFSLSGGASASIFWYEGYTAVDLGINLFAKYDILKASLSNNIFNLGAQAGIVYATAFTNATSASLPNILFLAAGVYVDAYVTPKLNVFFDSKFPLGFFFFESGASDSFFFKKFFYDLKVGATYSVSPKINVGLEFGISNTNFSGAWNFLMSSYNSLILTAGAKVVYLF